MLTSKPGEGTHLGFPHDFGIFPNPNDQHELFPLGFLVIGVAHTSVPKRGLRVVQDPAQLVQATGARLSEVQFIGAFTLDRHKAKSARRGNSSGEIREGKLLPRNRAAASLFLIYRTERPGML